MLQVELDSIQIFIDKGAFCFLKKIRELYREIKWKEGAKKKIFFSFLTKKGAEIECAKLYRYISADVMPVGLAGGLSDKLSAEIKTA